jgi:hypothetical protein
VSGVGELERLVGELRAAAPALNASAAEAILADPFWSARYGEERSRKLAFEDGAYHLQYCVEALLAGDAGVMVTYARWLRSVLVPRGMCSEHLADNFRLLAGAIAGRGFAGGQRALEVLARAEAALVHDASPAASALQEASPALTEAAAADVAAHLAHAVPRAELVFDLRHLVSYLADALALGAPATFVAHVRWAEGYLTRRGRPPGYLRALLAALDHALATAVPAAAADVRALLAPSLTELAS